MRVASSLQAKLNQFRQEHEDGKRSPSDEGHALKLLVFGGRTDTSMDVQHQLKRSMGRGEVRTMADLRDCKERIMDGRGNDTAMRVASIKYGIDRLKGKVLQSGEYTPIVVANLKIGKIEELLTAHPDIDFIAEDVKREIITPATPTDEVAMSQDRRQLSAGKDDANGAPRRRLVCDGRHRNEIHHFDKFYPDYNGAGTYYGRENVPLGIAEVPFYISDSGVNNEHMGFRASAGGPFRFTAPKGGYLYNCIDEEKGCKEVKTYDEKDESEHATNVMGLAAGDAMNGQATSEYEEVDDDWNKAHTGVCPKCSLCHYQTSGFDSSLAAALDATLACDKKHTQCPNIINFSAGGYEKDCLGTDGGSKVGNSFFKNGKLLIAASGNERDAVDAETCSAASPGMAHAVLTVGSLGGFEDLEEGTNCVGEEISYFSSEGDYETDRSIVDVVCQGLYTSMYDKDGKYLADGGGTSFASPVMAGYAALFSDWYLSSDFGKDVHDPGVMMVATLLQTNFKAGKDKFLDHGFDRLYGGGVLKAERFDKLKEPAGVALGTMCVADGEEVDIEVGPLDEDVGKLTAVIFWFDPRAEKGQTWANLDLSCVDKSSNKAVTESKAVLDNKERCTIGGGTDATLRVRAVRVPGTDKQCGSKKQLVYYGYLYQSE